VQHAVAVLDRDILAGDKGVRTKPEAVAMNTQLLNGFQKQEVDALRKFLCRMRDNLNSNTPLE